VITLKFWLGFLGQLLVNWLPRRAGHCHCASRDLPGKWCWPTCPEIVQEHAVSSKHKEFMLPTTHKTEKGCTEITACLLFLVFLGFVIPQAGERPSAFAWGLCWSPRHTHASEHGPPKIRWQI